MLPVTVAPISHRLLNIFYDLTRFVAFILMFFLTRYFPFTFEHWHMVQVDEKYTVQMMYEQWTLNGQVIENMFGGTV